MLETVEKPAVFPLNSTSGFTLPELVLPPILPTDVDTLTALLHSLIKSHDDVKLAALSHISFLHEQIVLARRRMFGPSAESAGQFHLFDEAEVLAATSTEAQDVAQLPTPAKAQKPARGKRSPLPPELERVEIIHDVPESERICDCGTPMVVINRVISEQLDIVPMQVRVLQHIRLVYGCKASEHAPVTAMLPPQPLPKSNASPGLLAMLLTTKYVDGLPLARFEKVLARHDVTVPRQTLARWVIGASTALQPLHNLMRDALFDAPFIHMDETVVQVLKEKGKSPTSNSYMWVQTGGPPGKQVVIYDYDPSRSGEVPARLLLGYQGYLMTDGYEGYNKLAKTEGIEHLVCWAHVRRKFVDAVKVQPKGTHSHADQAVAMIGKLYSIEREHKDPTDEVRYAARQEEEAYRCWMNCTMDGKGCCPWFRPRAHWVARCPICATDRASLFVTRSARDLPVDNNRCENSIRPFVVGRKAWLFSDTPAGARNASATIHSCRNRQGKRRRAIHMAAPCAGVSASSPNCG